MNNASLQEQAKQLVRQLQPLVRIGKSGLTEGIISEITKQLKKHKLVKIKMLRPFLAGHDRHEAGALLAAACHAELLQVVGNVVVLWKKV